MRKKVQQATLYLRKDKIRSDNKMPLYIRFKRVDGREPKFVFGEGFFFSEDEWDAKSKRANAPEIDILIQDEYQRIRREITNNTKPLSFDDLKAIVAYRKPEDIVETSFYFYWDKFVALRKKNDRISASTEKGYRSTRNALTAIYPDLKIEDINVSIIEELEAFIKERNNALGRGDALAGRQNHKKRIKGVIEYIERLNIPIKNPFKTEEVSIVRNIKSNNEGHLTITELRKVMLYYKKRWKAYPYFHEAREVHILGMFVTSCLTGLRISDVLSLKWKEVIRRNQEVWLIKKIQKKTKTEVIIPVSSYIHDFVFCVICSPEGDEFYEEDRYVFHVRSSVTRINKELKKLAQALNINKNITSHYGRRTFATLLANNENNTDYVSRHMMGHEAKNTTEKYQKWGEDEAAMHKYLLEIMQYQRPCNFF